MFPFGPSEEPSRPSLVSSSRIIILGKSSVLESIVGRDFTKGSGIVTDAL